MIFRPELVKQIRAGKKTMTRRPAITDTCRYVAGKAYAVQPGRGRSAVCRITVLEVRLEPLGAITLPDVRREGFVTTLEFSAYWELLHGRFDPDQPVWAIRFLLGDLTDEPRLLAARPGAPHGDYVTNPHLAIAGEPEALSEHETERLGKISHERDHQRSKDPLRIKRDQLARALAEMHEAVAQHGPEHRDRMRRFERELQHLNRELAA